MENTNEVEYPSEATIGDQWRRELAREEDEKLALPFLSSADLHRRISQVAYELYVRRGKLHGHDLEDWLAAESMVLSQFARSEKQTGAYASDEETKRPDLISHASLT